MVKISYLSSFKTCTEAAEKNYKLFGSSALVLGY